MTASDFTGWREPWPLTSTLHQLAEPRSVIVEMLWTWFECVQCPVMGWFKGAV